MMPASGESSPLPVRQILARLRAGLGPVEPWAAEAPMEYVCGAILVQHTAWRNVEPVLEVLRAATAFDEVRLLGLDDGELVSLIRPAGFMLSKSRALRAYADWSLSRAGRGAAELADDELRAELESLPGIGPETADVVALMVFGRRRFIFDAYGRRLLRQAGYAVGRSYRAARARLEGGIDAEGLSHAELVELHGLILQAGQRARASGGWPVYGPTIGVGG